MKNLLAMMVAVFFGCPLFGALADGLVAYYKFDGNTDDSSGNAYNLINQGANFVADRHDVSGGAVYFDGDSKLIPSANWLMAEEGGTIACWIKADRGIESFYSESTSGTRYDAPYAVFPVNGDNFSGETYGNVVGVGFAYGNNGVMIYEHAGGYLPTPLVYRADLSGWRHVAVTFEKNGREQLFIDGILVRTGLTSDKLKTFGMSANKNWASGLQSGIGGSEYGNFAGSMDDLRIYNRALSAAEVKTLYEGENDKGLVAWYKFDGNANDSSGNGYDLAVKTDCGDPVPTLDRFGNASAAYSFNGDEKQVFSDDDAPNPMPEIESTFSFSFWFKSDKSRSDYGAGWAWNLGNYAFFPMHGGDNGGAGLGVKVGVDGIEVVEHASFYMPTVLTYEANLGNGWNHVTVTIANSGAPCLYVNGVKVGEGEITDRMKKVRPCGIGGDIWGYYTGCVDDLRIYNRALSAAEVKALYEGDGAPVLTKCAVMFDAAGGTAGWSKGEVVKGTAVGSLPTATREGYEFLGWFTAAVGGAQVTAATVVTEDVTFYAQWRKIDETPIATYGPWGEAEAVKNPDKLGPTMLTDMTLELNGAAGAVGDVVAAFRGDTGALCGLGKVMDESGTLSMVCYAPTGVKLHFKVWVAASGVEEPVVVDCDAKSDLTAPTSGAFLSGHALVVSDDKDLMISLGSADWHTVSFNVLPEDPSPAAVFGSVKAKIAAVTQGIEFWMPGKSSSLKAIEIGKGYWVNTKADNVEWTVSGKTDPKAEIALEEGWNLVGYAPEAEGAVQQVLKTALAAKAVDYVTYGVEFYPGGTLKKMEPGKAYWVHAKKAYTLVYDDGAAGVRALPLRAGALNAAAVPTYGPWGESEAVKNPDKLGPTFLTDMAVEIDGEPAAYGDVVAVFRGDTGALCGLGKVMDDSGTLTLVCYAPKGVTLSFKVWLSESGVEEAVVVKCDNASKLIAPESGDFYDGHAISGSTAVWSETIIAGEKVTIETELIGYTASGLPSGLKYNKTTGLITGSASKLTAAEGVVVKFTKKDAEDEELTIVVRAEEISAGCEELSSGPLPAGVAGAVGGMDIQIDSEGGTKSVSVTKLPSGMKYDSKTGKITGAPTKAGEYEVVLTVTTKYGNKKTEKISVSVAAMPVMAVGKFDGFVSDGGDNLGTFTLTTTDAGKLTAKVVTAAGTVSFSGTCWDAVEKGVYRATLTTKKGEKLTLTLDSAAAWDANQLTGSYSSASGRALDVTAQKNAFGKTWYFSAVGNESTGWKLAYIEDTKGAALTVTLKADGAVSIAGTLQGTKDAKGKATTFKVSASGYANVCGLKDGAILADFAPILTVNKVKTVLAITTNLWFDRKNEVGRDVGQAKFAE